MQLQLVMLMQQYNSDFNKRTIINITIRCEAIKCL